MSEQDIYQSPLAQRYANRAMAELWSPQRRITTWRQLWVALAEAQMELGLFAEDGKTPRIRPEQIQEMKARVGDVDFERAAYHEKRLRHDVMAHVHTFGEACPRSAEIIHLGATSCYVTDNADLLLMREALQMIQIAVVNVIDALASFAEQWKALPTLGYTHYQPAQLTTVGKRACLWCQDFLIDLQELEHRLGTLRFRGVKGTTGTQASFLSLFGNDERKVRRLDTLVAAKMGFEDALIVSGQTYPRKVDTQMLDALAGIGQSAHKFGTDLRLLAHDREIEEPQEDEQIGSSAMPYKRNPMRAERTCALGRFLTSLPANAAQTAATQWLERTLDDSAIRRIVLPEAFLAADAVLRVALNLSRGLQVNEAVVQNNVERELPFMATENVLMQGVAAGGNRQELHEALRRHSHVVTAERKAGKSDSDLLERLKSDPVFARVDLDKLLQSSQFTGRAEQQVDEFIAVEIQPVRKRFGGVLGATGELDV